METKDIILEAALELFAQKGYQASSVREIAAKIGFKESALYFHYKNKQAILDSLLDKFIDVSERMMSYLSDAMNDVTSINDAQFYAVTEQYIQGYYMDGFIGRFIMVMNHERSHNERLREQYIRWCVDKPIEFQTMVIQRLQAIGYLKKLEAAHTALSYYAPIFLYFNQYMNHEYSGGDKASFKNAVMAAAKEFLSIYKEEA